MQYTNNNRCQAVKCETRNETEKQKLKRNENKYLKYYLKTKPKHMDRLINGLKFYLNEFFISIFK